MILVGNEVPYQSASPADRLRQRNPGHNGTLFHRWTWLRAERDTWIEHVG